MPKGKITQCFVQGCTNIPEYKLSWRIRMMNASIVPGGFTETVKGACEAHKDDLKKRAEDIEAWF